VDTTGSFVGQLLIAMPSLGDPNFQRTVVLIAAHSIEDGAFGLVVNRPLDVELAEIFDELGMERPTGSPPPVLAGGPVEPGHGFVLFESGERPGHGDDLDLPHGLRVSGSTETLAGLAGGDVPSRYSLILGYSGWYPGQLETEIEENSWLIAPLAKSIVFDVPHEDRWIAALDSIGVDPGTIVDGGSAAPA
jgi:putative transcriptional regulator